MALRPVETMTSDELRDELIQRKLAAFDQCNMLLKASEETLHSAGFKAPIEVIERAAKLNEKRLREWEKAHPD